jgi:hypothetical protein
VFLRSIALRLFLTAALQQIEESGARQPRGDVAVPISAVPMERRIAQITNVNVEKRHRSELDRLKPSRSNTTIDPSASLDATRFLPFSHPDPDSANLTALSGQVLSSSNVL